MTASFNPNNTEDNRKQQDGEDKVFVSFNANLVPPTAQPTFPLHWNFIDGDLETNEVIKPLKPLGPGEAIYFPSKKKTECMPAPVNAEESLWHCREIYFVVQKLKEKVKLDIIKESIPHKSLKEIQELINILADS